jgi:hypothetical protein
VLDGFARLGDAGLPAPLVAVLVGLLVPPLAALGQLMLAPCVVVLLAMSVLLAEPGRLQWREMGPVGLLALANLVITPLAAHLLAQALGLDEIGGWLVLVAACPAAGSAAMMAGLLGLPVRPMLLAQLLCFFALPFSAPLVAGLVLDGAVIDPWELLWRVTVMVGLPSLLALGLRLALGEARRREFARPARGLGTASLCGIGLAIAAGLPAGLALDGPWQECLTGLAVVSLLGGALGAIAGLAGGTTIAAAFALGGAVRNVSLLWSATEGLATPAAEMVMQMGTLWTLLLPALLGLRGWWPRVSDRSFRLAVAVLALLTMR